jgi:hypothetical protein
MAIRSEEEQDCAQEQEMAGIGNDNNDAEWTGRPQDDPRYIAAATAARQAYRAKHPPVNCWVDSVHQLDLYLDGRRRARVLTDKATVQLLDDDGNVTGSLIYLRSETPYEAVEKHLGIGRVEDVRDDSNDGGGEISPRPRKQSERSARAFRKDCPAAEEADRYLRDALNTFAFFGGPVMPAGRAWHRAIEAALDALAQGDRKTARTTILAAVAGMNKDTILDWQVAWVDCARAAEALARDLLAEMSGHIDGTDPQADERSGG